ncbi:hypothetical protein D9M71_556330 [compost metagenome]
MQQAIERVGGGLLASAVGLAVEVERQAAHALGDGGHAGIDGADGFGAVHVHRDAGHVSAGKLIPVGVIGRRGVALEQAIEELHATASR